MKILAFDTSTEKGSVSVVLDGRVAAEIEGSVGGKHAETILERIEEALSLAGIGLGELDAIGVGVGPGSFTGVRVALSTAKGLAIARPVPVVGVVSLAAMAREVGRPGELVMPALDAFKGEVYAALYRVAAAGEGLEIIAPPTNLRPEALDAWARTHIQDRPVVRVGPAPELFPRARAIAAETLARLTATEGKGDDLAALEPLYVRPPDATRPAALATTYDAVLLLSFGGPERQEDVLPFLENVTRGRGIPRERLEEVAGHYRALGGVSPINAANRALCAAIEEALAKDGVPLKVYWGNRNWHPLLADTLREMRADGVQRALAFVTAAFGSYSGCRQYLENVEAARAELGEGAPVVDKLRLYFDHPGFIEPVIAHTRAALESLPAAARGGARLVFTAHSIPTSMAEGGPYVAQLRASAALVAAALDREGEWDLVYQSRSGSPEIPWLEPDVSDHLEALARGGTRAVCVVPLGFISDHVEVIWDLDRVARAKAEELGLAFARAVTAATHPRFAQMASELVRERVRRAPRLSLSGLGPANDACAPGCCPAPRRRPSP